ncbi:MAG: phenylalanine--tRNA ligase subunit alpha, partial [Ferruginibacter sp.]
MDELLAKIRQYKDEMNGAPVTDIESLEGFRIKYLGTKGIVKKIMGEMKNVAPELRKDAGQVLNEFKTYTAELYDSLKQHLVKESPLTHKTDIDLTLPGYAIPVGARHPLSIVQNKIISIFHRLGFS